MTSQENAIWATKERKQEETSLGAGSGLVVIFDTAGLATTRYILASWDVLCVYIRHVS